MNIVRSLAQYLQDTGVATLGQDLFISRAPSTLKSENRLFWLKANGGSAPQKSVNGGSRKQYAIEIYHRDVNTAGVYDTLQELGDDLTSASAVTLEDFDVMEIAINGPWTDQDLDSEEREVGMLIVNITVHKEL